jgi:hypothetical protein
VQGEVMTGKISEDVYTANFKVSRASWNALRRLAFKVNLTASAYLRNLIEMELRKNGIRKKLRATDE